MTDEQKDYIIGLLGALGLATLIAWPIIAWMSQA